MDALFCHRELVLSVCCKLHSITSSLHACVYFSSELRSSSCCDWQLAPAGWSQQPCDVFVLESSSRCFIGYSFIWLAFIGTFPLVIIIVSFNSLQPSLLSICHQCCQCYEWSVVSPLLHCESKKQATILLPVTSSNADRISNFFHSQTH